MRCNHDEELALGSTLPFPRDSKGLNRKLRIFKSIRNPNSDKSWWVGYRVHATTILTIDLREFRLWELTTVEYIQYLLLKCASPQVLIHGTIRKVIQLLKVSSSWPSLLFYCFKNLACSIPCSFVTMSSTYTPIEGTIEISPRTGTAFLLSRVNDWQSLIQKESKFHIWSHSTAMIGERSSQMEGRLSTRVDCSWPLATLYTRIAVTSCLRSWRILSVATISS